MIRVNVAELNCGKPLKMYQATVNLMVATYSIIVFLARDTLKKLAGIRKLARGLEQFPGTEWHRKVQLNVNPWNPQFSNRTHLLTFKMKMVFCPSQRMQFVNFQIKSNHVYWSSEQ